ncbi:Rid family detoxifying hydrolase [Pontimicrobium sp. SW4]|uniref:Rid family detoxifying hydrolase n=1 Tax=Pontimicrobium sp. SW4 TaxID=3153519 RepID=A0AAU7BT93_9FLAO
MKIYKVSHFMKIVSSPEIPKSLGHYSMCIEHNDTLYLSGQIPIDPATGKVPNTIEKQTFLLLQNIEKTLKEAGSDKNRILRNEVFLADIADWSVVNKIYSDFFGTHKPARMVVGGVQLHHDSLIGITTTAELVG